jgi:hypothetical protein
MAKGKVYPVEEGQSVRLISCRTGCTTSSKVPRSWGRTQTASNEAPEATQPSPSSVDNNNNLDKEHFRRPREEKVTKKTDDGQTLAASSE